jgi:hypothetical protein
MQRPRPPRTRRTKRTGLLLACIALAVPAVALAAEPTASTDPIDLEAVEQDYALVTGIINPGGVATSYFVQYGPTTEYGQATPTIPIGSGKNDVGVSVGIDGLTPGTTYHYRVVATYTPTKEYAAGLAVGADQTFTTLAAPPPLALAITNPKKVSVDSKGFASLSLACTGPAGKTCAGKLGLRAKVKLPGARKAKVRNLGKALYTLKAGKTKTLRLKLPAAVADALAASKSGRLAAVAKTKTRSTKAPVQTKVTLVSAG